MSYNNAVLTITQSPTPDPFVIAAHNTFYITFTAGDRIEIWASPHLLALERTAHKATIFRPSPDTPYAGGLWAPELHALNGRWHVVFAAEHPARGNKSHRTYVLRGPPASQDPTAAAAAWDFAGPLRGLPAWQWAIDATMFEVPGFGRFAVYSGWPEHNPGLSDLVQQLWIVKMGEAVEAVGRAVCLLRPQESWEWSGDHGILEGPQWLQAPDGGWSGIVYSCAGSWTKDYKMSTLRYLGGDPLDVNSWRRSKQPLLTSKQWGGGGPYGPGHGSFVHVGGETLAIFHAKDGDDGGWEGRKARVQRVMWSLDGPYMGGVTGPMVPTEQAFMMMPAGGIPAQQPQRKPEDQIKSEVKGLFKKIKDTIKNL